MDSSNKIFIKIQPHTLLKQQNYFDQDRLVVGFGVSVRSPSHSAPFSLTPFNIWKALETSWQHSLKSIDLSEKDCFLLHNGIYDTYLPFLVLFFHSFLLQQSTLHLPTNILTAYSSTYKVPTTNKNLIFDTH